MYYEKAFKAGVWFLDDPGVWLGRALIYKLQGEMHRDENDVGPTVSFPCGDYNGGEMIIPQIHGKFSWVNFFPDSSATDNSWSDICLDMFSSSILQTFITWLLHGNHLKKRLQTDSHQEGLVQSFFFLSRALKYWKTSLKDGSRIPICNQSLHDNIYYIHTYLLLLFQTHYLGIFLCLSVFTFSVTRVLPFFSMSTSMIAQLHPPPLNLLSFQWGIRNTVYHQ